MTQGFPFSPLLFNTVLDRVSGQGMTDIRIGEGGVKVSPFTDDKISHIKKSIETQLEVKRSARLQDKLPLRKISIP